MCSTVRTSTLRPLQHSAILLVLLLSISWILIPTAVIATVAPLVRLDWKVTGGHVAAGQPVELMLQITCGPDVGTVEVEMEASPTWRLKWGSLLWRESIGRQVSGVDSVATLQRLVTVIPEADPVEPIIVRIRVTSPQEFETSYRINLAYATPAGVEMLLPTPRVLDPNMWIREDEGTIPAELLELDRRCRDSILSTMVVEKSESANLGTSEALGRLITVTGRIGYIDDHSLLQYVPGCRVKLKDEDTGSDDTIDETLTHSDGSFTLYCNTSQLGEEDPELYLMIYPDNPLRCKVQLDGIPWDLSSRYPTSWHHEPSDHWSVGTLTFEGQWAGIFHIFKSVYQAHLFMDSFDSPAPKVVSRAYAPGNNTYYDGSIRIDTLHIWSPFTHTHEFGHHIVRHFLESPSPDYCNDECDLEGGRCSHCLWSPEKDFIAFTEGWPHFLAETCNDVYSYDDYWGIERYTGQWPTRDPEHVEGNIAAVLYDICDGVQDDHNNDGLADMLDLGFGDQWRVMREYHPRGEASHPRTADEIYSGFVHFFPTLKYRLVSTFQENEIPPAIHFYSIKNDTTVLGGGLFEDLTVSRIFSSEWSAIGVRPTLGDWDIRVDETADFSTPFEPPMATGRTPDMIVTNGAHAPGWCYANVFGGVLTTCLIEMENMPKPVAVGNWIEDTLRASEVLNLYQIELGKTGSYLLDFAVTDGTEDVEVMVFSPTLRQGSRLDAIGSHSSTGLMTFDASETGSYCVLVAKSGSAKCEYGFEIVLDVSTDVNDDIDEEIPSLFALKNAYPNPFNPTTTIGYDMPKASHVALTIYNILGERIATLVDAHQSAGRHVVTWDGTSDQGSKVGSGVYFYRLSCESFSNTKKMILLK